MMQVHLMNDGPVTMDLVSCKISSSESGISDDSLKILSPTERTAGGQKQQESRAGPPQATISVGAYSSHSKIIDRTMIGTPALPYCLGCFREVVHVRVHVAFRNYLLDQSLHLRSTCSHTVRLRAQSNCLLNQHL